MSSDRENLTAAMTAAHDQRAAAARQYAPVLLRRVQQLLANGIDLNDPGRLCDLASDQVADAIVESCTVKCEHDALAAAAVLAAELARLLAEATR